MKVEKVLVVLCPAAVHCRPLSEFCCKMNEITKKLFDFGTHKRLFFEACVESADVEEVDDYT